MIDYWDTADLADKIDVYDLSPHVVLACEIKALVRELKSVDQRVSVLSREISSTRGGHSEQRAQKKFLKSLQRRLRARLREISDDGRSLPAGWNLGMFGDSDSFAVLPDDAHDVLEGNLDAIAPAALVNELFPALPLE